MFDNDEQNQMAETAPKLAKGYDANSWLFYAMRSASYAMRSAVSRLFRFAHPKQQ